MKAMYYAYGGNTNDIISILRQKRHNHDFSIILKIREYFFIA
jgi:hypothetical protein